jgi:hypothetical protein
MKVTILYALFVWVCNLVSYITGRTQVEDFWQQGVQEDIWAPKREGSRKMGKLHNDEVSELSNMIRMIRSRSKWAGNVTRKGEKTHSVLEGKPGGRDHLEDLDVDK